MTRPPRIVRIGHFPYEISDFLANDVDTIEFCDYERPSGVEVPVMLYISSREIQSASDLLESVTGRSDQECKVVPRNGNGIVPVPFDLIDWTLCASGLDVRFCEAALKVGRDDP